MNIAVVYSSRTGNTKAVGEAIARSEERRVGERV